MTMSQSYNDLTQKLQTIYGPSESESIADWIFERITGLKKWERRPLKDQLLQKGQQEGLVKYWGELQTNKPVQYVLNEAWFYKLKFFVDERVLIPRPETEELVEWAISDQSQNGEKGKEIVPAILDIGTGSGCIAVALEKGIEGAAVTGIDYSEGALKVAMGNARALGAQVNFRQIDFLDESKWVMLGDFDLIVSNPPYIPFSHKGTLDRNVANFEPKSALFVPDENPLIFYEKIAAFGRLHLNKGGRIYAEIHEDFSGKVRQVFEDFQFRVTEKKDVYGRDRMIMASALSI